MVLPKPHPANVARRSVPMLTISNAALSAPVINLLSQLPHINFEKMYTGVAIKPANNRNEAIRGIDKLSNIDRPARGFKHLC